MNIIHQPTDFPYHAQMPFLWRLAGPAILLLLSISFYWKLVLTNQYSWTESPDMAHMVLPRFQFMAAEWHHMRFPLWDPYQWNGQPFLGQWTGAAMPLNWPLFVLGGFREGKIRTDLLHWYFLLVHWLGAVFCYWLCRDLGRSRAAAILAGCLFAFGGYFGNADWPEVFTGVVWTPLVFLFLFRAMDGRKPLANAALAGVFCGLSWLSGHHQAPLYLTLAVAGIWFCRALLNRDWKLAWLGAVTLAFTALTGAMQLLPGREYGQLAMRWAGTPEPLSWKEIVPYAVHEHYSLVPLHAVGILFPFDGGHVSLFVGVVGVLLAVAGLRSSRDDLAVRVLAATAAAGILFAMPVFNPFYGVFYNLLPMFEKARVPARTVMLFSFAVAPLAAYGLDFLRERTPSSLPRWLLVAGAAGFAAAFALREAAKLEFVDRLSGTGLVLLMASGVLLAGGRLMPAGLIVLSMIEMSRGRAFVPTERPESLTRPLWSHKDIVEFLKQQPAPFRVETSPEIPHNFGDWNLIESVGGFTAGVTANLHRLGWSSQRTRDLLGITYSIAKQPTQSNQEEVFASTSGWKVFRNPTAFPRAWVVHEALRVPGPDAVPSQIANPGVDLRRTAVIVAESPALETCEGGAEGEAVRWVERQASRIRFEVEARCRGLVVVTDTWYPGWRATVNGQTADILEVDGAFRGVVVNAGKNSVEMKYQPWTFYVGALLTLTGIGVAQALVLWRPPRTQDRFTYPRFGPE